MSDQTKTSPAADDEIFPEVFQVRPGIPFDHAFAELSVLLGCVKHLTREAEMESDRQAGSAARILSDFAKALINDMERSRMRPH